MARPRNVVQGAQSSEGRTWVRLRDLDDPRRQMTLPPQLGDDIVFGRVGAFGGGGPSDVNGYRRLILRTSERLAMFGRDRRRIE